MRRFPSQLLLRPALELLLEHWHRAPHCTGILGSADRKQGADLAPASGVWQPQAGRVSKSLVAWDCVLAMPAPGSRVGTHAGTEVRMTLEKRSRWEGWLGAVQDKREGNLLTVPSTQAGRALWWCSCPAHGEGCDWFWFQAWVLAARSFTLSKDIMVFLTCCSASNFITFSNCILISLWLLCWICLTPPSPHKLRGKTVKPNYP